MITEMQIWRRNFRKRKINWVYWATKTLSTYWFANTKLNIEQQLFGERDKTITEWMKDRIKDEKK